MQAQLSWTDLINKKVGLWGLGIEGKASQALLRSMGIEPVVVVDEKLAESNIASVLSLDNGGKKQLLDCDVVIKSPGVSRYLPEAIEIAKSASLVSGLSLWLSTANTTKVVFITGTKGKSTTSALVAQILEALDFKVFLGGNFGFTPYSPEVDQDSYEYWVIEVSSYQATDLSITPKVIGLTSLHPDHLAWHGSIEKYYSDKLSILLLAGDHKVVANSDNEELKNRSELQQIEGQVRYTTQADLNLDDSKQPRLKGLHNRSNMAVAIGCVEELLARSNLSRDPKVIDAIINFDGLAHRFQTVAKKDGVEFINDSLSTNSLPTIAAMEALPGLRIALILGGFDRGVDQSDLVEYLCSRSDNTFIAAMPDTGTLIASQLEKLSLNNISTVKCKDLESAVKECYNWARAEGDVVLLSPAAASFNAFKDYKERGLKFAEYANEVG